MLLNSQSGLPLEFTQGDTVTLELIATDDLGNPVNLTGASLSTQILGPNGDGVATFGDGQHTLGDQSTNPGTFALALANTDTPNCGEGPNKQILTEAAISGATVYYRGINLLTVYPSSPQQ